MPTGTEPGPCARSLAHVSAVASALSDTARAFELPWGGKHEAGALATIGGALRGYATREAVDPFDVFKVVLGFCGLARVGVLVGGLAFGLKGGWGDTVLGFSRAAQGGAQDGQHLFTRCKRRPAWLLGDMCPPPLPPLRDSKAVRRAGRKALRELVKQSKRAGAARQPGFTRNVERAYAFQVGSPR
jgi:hypothetical protein